ncbi:MAG: hypothetical protein U0232_30735 [Thermomicrobiales bacterium]
MGEFQRAVELGRRRHLVGGANIAQRLVVADDDLMIVRAQLELHAIGMELPRQFLDQSREGVFAPGDGLAELGIEDGDLRQPVHLHDQPVVGPVEIVQPPGVLPHRLEPVHDQVVGEGGRAVAGVERGMPGAAHADAGLDGAPAEGRVAGRILRHDRLPHPGAEEPRHTRRVALVAGLAVALAEDRPLGVAAKLPGPLAILVVGRVGEPVHLAREAVHGAARHQLQAQGALGHLRCRLAGVDGAPPAVPARDAQQPFGLERRAHVGREQSPRPGNVAVRHRARDAGQPRPVGVDQPPEELGIAQSRTLLHLAFSHAPLPPSAIARVPSPPYRINARS